ncbi:hypothetical protein CEXT_237801 [Caerostris extrusa]|uniref:Uncharacterized protein n=1 Tax=Caerostris extrusa TaxID=172846 RepID=A0AAV4UZ75_CAEEX|nr:hypothetical protein CEXT_237801 [Caerostris extrusa]
MHGTNQTRNKKTRKHQFAKGKAPTIIAAHGIVQNFQLWKVSHYRKGSGPKHQGYRVAENCYPMHGTNQTRNKKTRKHQFAKGKAPTIIAAHGIVQNFQLWKVSHYRKGSRPKHQGYRVDRMKAGPEYPHNALQKCIEYRHREIGRTDVRNFNYLPNILYRCRNKNILLLPKTTFYVYLPTPQTSPIQTGGKKPPGTLVHSLFSE